jgi:hypothetical protein
MIEGNKLDSHIEQTLAKVKGLLRICSIRTEDRQEILHLEDEAEKRSLMGMGKVSNIGVKKALQFDSLYLGLTSLEFNWGQCSSLVLMKGDQLVGEDIYDEETIAKLSTSPNAWFLHKNFVIYKDLISFPKDIMQKICHFEIPGTTVDWIPDDTENGVRFEIWYGYPSTFCDVYLKEHYFEEYLKESYFDGSNEKGLGTIVIGVNSISDTGKEKVE